jgi:uncharacterized protein DUF4249
MSMKYRHRLSAYFLGILIATVIYSCRKPYNPPAIAAANNYLVVEGQINSGSDSTIIRLSRTVKVSSKDASNPETNAIVTIQGDQNASYSLTEFKPGSYTVSNLNLDKTHKYRLSIKTANGGQYVSDYMPVLDSPPIDSVSYDGNGGKIEGDGVNIYVSTHDPSNNVKYYRWDFQETWEFHSFAESEFKADLAADTVLPRDMVNDEIYSCWKSDTSTSVLLGSTAQLSKSEIINNQVAFVNSVSEKVSVEYSILVRQYALSADAYSFYSTVKRITEQLGSIFDAQPSQVSGNIHSVTNPSEPVIGYICVGGVATKRIFIKHQQLPYWVPLTFYITDNCAYSNDPQYPAEPCCFYKAANPYGVIENQVKKYIILLPDNLRLVPIFAFHDRVTGAITGFSAAERECVDCTLRGSNKQPAFWQ